MVLSAGILCCDFFFFQSAVGNLVCPFEGLEELREGQWRTVKTKSFSLCLYCLSKSRG